MQDHIFNAFGIMAENATEEVRSRLGE